MVMVDLADSLAETLEAIAAAAHDAIEAPWRDKDSLRTTLAQIHILAGHAQVEAEDLRLLVDLEAS
jgi:hypothetical protein